MKFIENYHLLVKIIGQFQNIRLMRFFHILNYQKNMLCNKLTYNLFHPD